MVQQYKEISIRDLCKGYTHNGSFNNEQRVASYFGKLTIRPEYQREFVYALNGKTEKRDEVIRTILKNCCLGIFTWANNEDGTYECLDGQQRTISICDFVDNAYSLGFNGRRVSWEMLTDEEQNNFLDYKVLVNVVTGDESERLEWFKTINVAGVELTDQELRNAVYHGTWLSSAKSYFSRRSCVALRKYEGYISGTPERQDILETAIKWVSIVEEESSKGNSEDLVKYMCEHKSDEDANNMWATYQTILDWAKELFDADEKVLKTSSQNWGKLYKDYHNNQYDTEYTRKRALELIADEDVTNNKGVIEYILSGEDNEKYLNIRAFDNKMKRMRWEEQAHTCMHCGKEIKFSDARGDHIKPWILGGKTEYSNLQILCPDCNAVKSAKY